MAFKNFRFGVIIRISLLGLTIFALMYSVLQTHWHITVIVLLILLFIEVYNLIRFAETTNRDITQFLRGIEFRDHALSFNTEGKGKSFAEMRKAFNAINRQFQKITVEKEAHYQYLQAIVAHAGIGLLAYDAQGDIHLFNQAASELLSMPYLKNINTLHPRHPELLEILKHQTPIDIEAVPIAQEHGNIPLSFRSMSFKIQGESFTLVSLQNISQELKAKEIEAWQKLISVLTHEIMNSITPIASISSSLVALQENLESANHAEAMEDLKTGLRSIENRSKGLLGFVDVYRSFSQVPPPKLQPVLATQLLENLSHLMRKTLSEEGIQAQIIIKEPGLMLNIDPELIEQVLINLTLNAMDAVKGFPEAKIQYIAGINDHHKPYLMVADNGAGISQEILDKIFVPFFTTKKTGSGIGLSLSEQIMKLHSGTLSVMSSEGQGATFVLGF